MLIYFVIHHNELTTVCIRRVTKLSNSFYILKRNMILIGNARPFSKNTIFFKNNIYKQAKYEKQAKYIIKLDKLDIFLNDLCEVNYSVVNVLDIEQYHTGKHTCAYIT